MLSEKEKIKHLYNRAGFGMTVNDWKTKTNFQQEVDKLFQQKSYQSIQAQKGFISINDEPTNDYRSETAFARNGQP